MARRRLFLMLKLFDVYQFGQSNGGSSITNSQAFRYLDNRRKVHKDAINFCQDILRKKSNIDWEPILRTNLSQPIRNFDLVVTVGGDGTLLQASHFLDDSIPVLGVGIYHNLQRMKKQTNLHSMQKHHHQPHPPRRHILQPSYIQITINII
nr:NADH kinase-like isoform X1 [Populus alba]